MAAPLRTTPSLTSVSAVPMITFFRVSGMILPPFCPQASDNAGAAHPPKRRGTLRHRAAPSHPAGWCAAGAEPLAEGSRAPPGRGCRPAAPHAALAEGIADAVLARTTPAWSLTPAFSPG